MHSALGRPVLEYCICSSVHVLKRMLENWSAEKSHKKLSEHWKKWLTVKDFKELNLFSLSKRSRDDLITTYKYLQEKKIPGTKRAP